MGWPIFPGVEVFLMLIPIKEMDKLLCKSFNFRFFSKSKKTSMFNLYKA